MLKRIKRKPPNLYMFPMILSIFNAFLILCQDSIDSFLEKLEILCYILSNDKD